MGTTKATLYLDYGSMTLGPLSLPYLVVDAFGVKCVNKCDAEHLVSVLKDHSEVTEDWKGERYIGMHLRWDYHRRKTNLAMPAYLQKAMKELFHELPKRKQNSPFPCAQKKYGKDAQMMEDYPSHQH